MRVLAAGHEFAGVKVMCIRGVKLSPPLPRCRNVTNAFSDAVLLSLPTHCVCLVVLTRHITRNFPTSHAPHNSAMLLPRIFFFSATSAALATDAAVGFIGAAAIPRRLGFAK